MGYPGESSSSSQRPKNDLLREVNASEATKNELLRQAYESLTTCPITRLIMADPVLVSGVTYEREAIEEWIKSEGTHPSLRTSLSIPEEGFSKNDTTINARDIWFSKVPALWHSEDIYLPKDWQKTLIEEGIKVNDKVLISRYLERHPGLLTLKLSEYKNKTLIDLVFEYSNAKVLVFLRDRWQAYQKNYIYDFILRREQETGIDYLVQLAKQKKERAVLELIHHLHPRAKENESILLYGARQGYALLVNYCLDEMLQDKVLTEEVNAQIEQALDQAWQNKQLEVFNLLKTRQEGKPAVLLASRPMSEFIFELQPLNLSLLTEQILGFGKLNTLEIGQFDETQEADAIYLLEGHQGTVLALIELSIRVLASGSSDKTIQLWDLHNSLCSRKTLKGHDDRVNVLIESSTGFLISGSADRTIKVWDLKTDLCLKTLEGHTDWVTAFALSSTGLLLSGSRDCSIKVWDLETGLCLKTLEGHADWVNALVLLPTGLLASASSDKTIKIWDLETGLCLKTLEEHTDGVNALVLLSTGLLASGSSDKSVKLWDLETDRCIRTLLGHTDWVMSLLEVSLGLLVSGSTKTIRFWDLQTGECVKAFREEEGQAVRPLLELSIGCIASGFGQIKFWPLPSRALALKFDPSLLDSAEIQFAEQERQLTLKIPPAVVEHCRQLLERIVRHYDRGFWKSYRFTVSPTGIDIKAPNPEKTQRLMKLIQSLIRRSSQNDEASASSSSSFVLIEGDEGQGSSSASSSKARIEEQAADLWTLTDQFFTRPNLKTLSLQEFDKSQVVNEMLPYAQQDYSGSVLIELSSKLLASSAADHSIQLWDLKMHHCLKTFKGHKDKLLALLELSTGCLISAACDRTLKIWDLDRGICVQTLKGHRGNVCAVLELPSGYLVSASHDKTIKLWDLAKGRCIKTLIGHQDKVNALLLLSTGFLASASSDKTIKIWDLEQGVCIQTLEGHRGSVNALLELSTGALVSAAADRSIRLWELATGRCVRELAVESSVLCLLELSLGLLVSGSAKGTLQLWDLETNLCVSMLKRDEQAICGLLELSTGLLVSASQNNIFFWLLPTRTQKLTIKRHELQNAGIKLSQQGRQLILEISENSSQEWRQTVLQSLRHYDQGFWRSYHFVDSAQSLKIIAPNHYRASLLACFILSVVRVDYSDEDKILKQITRISSYYPDTLGALVRKQIYWPLFSRPGEHRIMPLHILATQIEPALNSPSPEFFASAGVQAALLEEDQFGLTPLDNVLLFNKTPVQVIGAWFRSISWVTMISILSRELGVLSLPVQEAIAKAYDQPLHLCPVKIHWLDLLRCNAHLWKNQENEKSQFEFWSSEDSYRKKQYQSLQKTVDSHLCLYRLFEYFATSTETALLRKQYDHFFNSLLPLIDDKEALGKNIKAHQHTYSAQETIKGQTYLALTQKMMDSTIELKPKLSSFLSEAASDGQRTRAFFNPDTLELARFAYQNIQTKIKGVASAHPVLCT